MKHNREFEIAWQGLKPGPHTYVYDIDEKFMQEHGGRPEYKDWNVRVQLRFDKHENFFMLHFDVDGKVTVPCDRCGDDFELVLWDEFDLLVKLATEEDGAVPEEEDDVVFIPHSETVIDISTWVYEFVMLSLPLQRIHPDKADGTPGCNEQALKLLGELSEEHEEENTNPVWKGLEAFRQETPEDRPKKKK